MLENFEVFGMRVAIVMHIIFLESCDDTNKDAVGLDCKGYEFWNLCSQSDKGKDDDFEAKRMCCVCGGGSVRKGKLTS